MTRGVRRRKRPLFRPQVAVEEGQSGLPARPRLTAVAEVEDVAGAGITRSSTGRPSSPSRCARRRDSSTPAELSRLPCTRRTGARMRLRLTQRRGPPQQRATPRRSRAAGGRSRHGSSEKTSRRAERRTGRFQPALEIGHRVVGDDRRGAAVVGGDQQAEHAALREAEEPDAPAGPRGMRRARGRMTRRGSPGPATETSFSRQRCPPALIVRRDCHIACLRQVVQHAPHLRAPCVPPRDGRSPPAARPGPDRPHPLQPHS